LHAASVQTTPEEVRNYGMDHIPYKVAQALDGRLDLDATNYFAENYLFGGLRHQVLDQGHARAALQLLLQINLATVAACISRPDPVKVRVRDQQVVLSSIPTESDAAGAWFRAYYYALIGRAHKALKELRDPGRYEDWMITDGFYSPYRQGHYLFLAFLEEPDIALQEYDRSTKAVARIPAQWRVLIDTFYPLWRPVLERNQSAFDHELEAAILRHQDYWAHPTEDEEDNMNDPKGHFSLELTGIMAYAHQIGLQINVGSDYTPLPLVTGEIQVDLDTPLDFYFS
jgi:hypothetical protein